MPRLLVLMVAMSLLLGACASQPPAPTPAPKPAAAPTTAPAAPAAAPTAAPAAPTAAPKPAATTAPTAAPAAKTTYPEKPVNFTVPYPAGGPVDAVGRTIAEGMKPFFPQPVVVVNRGGAAGTVGAAEVIRSKPDGYNIGITSHGTLVLTVHTADLPYKTPEDYTSIINTVASRIILAVPAGAPYNNLKDFVAYTKANPGKTRISATGVGSIAYVAGQIMQEQTKADFTIVPFDGAAAQVTALLGGHIDGALVGTQPVIGHVKAGTVKVLSVFGEKRDPQLPDVLTAREDGFDVVMGSAYTVFGPKGMPDPVVQMIHDAMKKTIETDAFKKFALESSLALDYKGGDELRQFMQRDYQTFEKLVKQ